MALPVIATPKFELILPSSGKKYKYRPFLVKEEKVLLIALEGGAPNEIITSIKEIIKSCVEGLNVDEMSIFDLEYVFLKLREKSISDTIVLYVKHIDKKNSEGNECDHVQEITVDLDKVEVIRNPDNNVKIQLTDSIGVVMKYPTIDLIDELTEFNAKSAFTIVERCIDYVYDEENTYPASDYSPKELHAFIESLSHSQFEKIERFFETLPKIQQEVKWKCNKCGSEEILILEGLNDFFI